MDITYMRLRSAMAKRSYVHNAELPFSDQDLAPCRGKQNSSGLNMNYLFDYTPETLDENPQLPPENEYGTLFLKQTKALLRGIANPERQ